MPNWEEGQQQGDGGGQPSLTTCFLAYSGREQVWRGGPCPGTDHRAPRADEGCWAGELCGARTEQGLLEADSEGPASYAPSPHLPENHLEGSLQQTSLASPPEFLIVVPAWGPRMTPLFMAPHSPPP